MYTRLVRGGEEGMMGAPAQSVGMRVEVWEALFKCRLSVQDESSSKTCATTIERILKLSRARTTHPPFAARLMHDMNGLKYNSNDDDDDDNIPN